MANPTCICCGTKRCDEPWHTVCPECLELYDIDVQDTEKATLFRGLSAYLNNEWPEEDREFLADTTAVTELLEDILPLMEPKLLKHLLTKPRVHECILRALTE